MAHLSRDMHTVYSSQTYAFIKQGLGLFIIDFAAFSESFSFPLKFKSSWNLSDTRNFTWFGIVQKLMLTLLLFASCRHFGKTLNFIMLPSFSPFLLPSFHFFSFPPSLLPSFLSFFFFLFPSLFPSYPAPVPDLVSWSFYEAWFGLKFTIFPKAGIASTGHHTPPTSYLLKVEGSVWFYTRENKNSMGLFWVVLGIWINSV